MVWTPFYISRGTAIQAVAERRPLNNVKCFSLKLTIKIFIIKYETNMIWLIICCLSDSDIQEKSTLDSVCSKNNAE